MQPSNQDLTRQEDELTISDSPEEVNEFRFGLWPEVVGLFMAGFITWMMFL
ncbi:MULTISPECIES: hypothetical protein [Modicisalibacter]|uniref:hypothetical protein n=1 Tax=Modicisalibacter TaxID=574347 RepID=UPI001396A138|nr:MULTISPECIES: hypothetical protein [Halomonadaceae]MBZ9560192.1 hypothetical protein [Modicisalibacter sp. R2A 31.J]MBZ9576100.1 hypothetical protein [Modicisalibacter sp. MOD 31.J]